MPCLATASSPPARDPLSLPAPQSWASTQKLSSPEGCPGSPINSVIPTKKKKREGVCPSGREEPGSGGGRKERGREGKGKKEKLTFLDSLN